VRFVADAVSNAVPVEKRRVVPGESIRMIQLHGDVLRCSTTTALQ
jgi:hypothetical protein